MAGNWLDVPLLWNISFQSFGSASFKCASTYTQLCLCKKSTYSSPPPHKLLFRCILVPSVRAGILSRGPVDRWCRAGYWVRLSSSRRRADLPYSAVYRVHVCFCVRRQPQSFIKGSTLKGQLNYSLLTGGMGGGGGGARKWLAWKCCYLAMCPLYCPPPPSPAHSHPPWEMRVPPRFRGSSIKSATPPRLSLGSGSPQIMGFSVVSCVCCEKGEKWGST